MKDNVELSGVLGREGAGSEVQNITEWGIEAAGRAGCVSEMKCLKQEVVTRITKGEKI